VAIVALEETHVPELVRLHLAELRSELSGRAGRELLTMRYATMVAAEGAAAWADVVAGRVAGFVALVWDERQLRQAIRRRFGFRFWWRLAGQAVARPQMLIRTQLDVGEKLPELRPIVVEASARGTETTNRLFAAIFAGAFERGLARIEAWIDEDNAVSLAAHRKRGFVEQARVGGRVRLVAEVRR
jgi:hypothetical protein